MNKIDFIGGNVKKCLFSMAIPMIIAMYLNMAYNLVDSIWIGNLLGEKAYAALANSTPIILLLTSIGMFFYYIIVRIPLAYILSINWGLNGIWISVLVSHIAACVASTISGRYCMLKYYKK